MKGIVDDSGRAILLAKELRIDYTNLELTLELKAKRDTP